MHRLAAVTIFMVLLAGCSGGSNDSEPSGTSSPSPTESASASATGAPMAPPPPPTAAAFTMTGPCKELLVIVSIPVAQARAFVPASYALLGEPTGRATGFIALKECADLAIDGVSIGPASTSDVGVFIDKGEPGVFHYYQAWWTTDNVALWARLAAQGWYGGVSNDTLVPLGGAVGAGEPSATVDYERANYTLSGQVAAGSMSGDNHAVGWFDAPNGTVTVDKVLRGTRLGSGNGGITADGDAARLFGPTASRGTALWNEYAMDGRVAFA